MLANNGGLNYESGTAGTFVLTQFNPEWGTLQSVLLEVTAIANGGSLWVDNEWTARGRVTLKIYADMTLQGPGTLMLYFMPELTTPSTYIEADVAGDGTGDFLGIDSLRLDGTSFSDVKSDTPSDINPYIGTGEVAYSFTGESYTTVTKGSPLNQTGRVVEQSVIPYYSFSATVTYTYDANPPVDPPPQVPEPGTLGMAAVLGGLALARLRRNRRANR